MPGLSTGYVPPAPGSAGVGSMGSMLPEQRLAGQADTVARRREIAIAIGGAEGGALSVLEHRYVHQEERPHGLPVAHRQARIRQRSGNRYLDNLYEEYGVCVELDGTAAHPADEQWRDKRRDNANTVQGIVTLRFGLADLGDRRCETAADVATVLRRHGWLGSPHPCPRPGCIRRIGIP